MSTFNIVHADITTYSADALVNSANRAPICGGSTEAKIYEKAGYDDLLNERQKIGPMAVCDVAATPAFKLSAKYLIFVSAPRWNKGKSGEIAALSICYKKILEKAAELNCKTVATPLLSSGVYRFPKGIALQVAKDSIEQFFKEHADISLDVHLILYDEESQRISKELFGNIENYINSHFLSGPSPKESFKDPWEEELYDHEIAFREKRLREGVKQRIRRFGDMRSSVYCSKENSKENLDEILRDSEDAESFRDRMISFMRDKNISAPELERNADIDRRLFSKINSKKEYRVSKNTALAIAIGLQLNYEEASELIALAGYALSPSNRADLIVRYFLENKEKFFREDSNKNQYKVPILNDILMDHGEEVLGYSRNIKLLA